MALVCVTGNKEKLREIQTLIAGVQSIDLDLPEIQEIDPYKVIATKLAEARKYHAGALLVEDTSLFLDGMNGLPGPLAKWFVKSIGVDGIYTLARTFGSRATARTILGYRDEHNEMHFFEGSLGGLVVSPRGTGGFGWDAIFQPDRSAKTFAEMTPEEKNQFSMRRVAIEGLRQHLELRAQSDAREEAFLLREREEPAE